jgi:putative membrane protein
MSSLIQIKYIISALVFSGIGLVVLAISFIVLDKLTPGDLWREIFVEKNLPLSLVVSAMILAVAQIIASAIHS